MPTDPDDFAATALTSSEHNPEDAVRRGDVRHIVRTALKVLPDEQRRAVVLAAVYGRTALEISESEGIPLGTAKTRIRTGMIRLRAAVAVRRLVLPVAMYSELDLLGVVDRVMKVLSHRLKVRQVIDGAAVEDVRAQQLIEHLAAKKFDPNEYADEHRARELHLLPPEVSYGRTVGRVIHGEPYEQA